MTDLPAEADVVVIGGGPAGLAAATLLGQLGAGRIIVLDRETEAGGVPRHCTHSPYGLREFRRLMTGPRYARALVRQAEASGVDIVTGVTVTALHSDLGPLIDVTSHNGPATIRARAVLLATGAREATRSERLIGGTKPQGVLSTGALQLILKTGQKPFHRPAILGTELVAFSALLSCRLAGIRPVAMIEPNRQTTVRWPSGLFPGMQGIPLLTDTGITRIEGHEHVTGIRLSTGDVIKADGLIVTGRFKPDAPLLASSAVEIDPGTGGPQIDQYGRCTALGYFAAGNLLRAVETAGWSWSEGRSVAHAIHAHLTGALPAHDGEAIRISGPVSAHVPQRVAPGPTLGLDRLQLRVARPVSGTLSLSCKGDTLHSRRVNTGPERRILLPLPQYGTNPEVHLSTRKPT